MEEREHKRALEGLERDRREAEIDNTLVRLQLEKAWVLHRALGLNVPPADAAERWKLGEGHEIWAGQRKEDLITKYYDILMHL